MRVKRVLIYPLGQLVRPPLVTRGNHLLQDTTPPTRKA
jgi:hypothetical protein